MLTKDLLRFRNSKQRIHPQFIDPHDSSLIEAAQDLIDLFKRSSHWTRETLLDASKETMEQHPGNAVVLRGLEKLLLDRTEFQTASNEELMALRQQIFAHTQSLRQTQSFESLEAYQTAVVGIGEHSVDELQDLLYSDLPPYQPVLSFKSISAQKLLHRYNCAQIQGLLLRTESIHVVLEHPPVAKLRQLFKYMRFYQLLAEITQPQKKTYHLKIDGPLSLFFQTQKYGMNLACFFPAILHMPQWELEAEVRIKPSKLQHLSLDDDCGIESHYQHFLAYVPDEIAMFQKNFEKKSKEWKVVTGSEFLSLPGEVYCFPDYEFQHPDKGSVFLEIFHGWHSAGLIARLQQVKKLKESRLILAVSRSLLKDPLIANSLENSEYFQKHGLLFGQLPTVDQLLKKLP